MNMPRHNVTLADGDWVRLVGLAALVVRDSEMPKDAPTTATRVSALLRLIARGDLLVVRPKLPEQQDPDD